jgi:hypothetical protein
MNGFWFHTAHQAPLLVIAAIVIFILVILAGIVTVVSHGIHREERRLRRERRFREQRGIWAGPDAPEYFFAERAPDVVSGAARRLNGLHVRHLPVRQSSAR